MPGKSHSGAVISVLLIRNRILLPLLALSLVATPNPCAGGDAAPSHPDAPGARRVTTPALPVDDPVYEELDRLDLLGLLPREILGHRPISLDEIAQLLETAERSADTPGTPVAAHEILTRLRRRFPAASDAPSRRSYAGAGVLASRSDQPPRGIPSSNGLGGIEAATRPFHAAVGGGPWSADGLTTRLTAGGGRSLGARFAATARGELRVLDGPDDSPSVAENNSDVRARLAGAQLRFRQANIVFEVGRQEAAWGPRPRGGFLLSRNTRPLDLISVACERPWRFPGFLRYVGTVRQSLLFADLGGARDLAHARLFAVRQTFRVTRHLELGFTETLIFGGDGAPSLSFGDFLYEVIPIGGRNGRRDLSDHRYGMDGRITVWPGRLVAFGDVFIDDSRAPLYDYFHTLLAKRVGLAAPALGPGGRWDARVEYAHVPAIGYRHGRWFSGYTVDGRILGDELGPDARGLVVGIGATLPAGQRIEAEFGYEQRDSDIWAQDPTEDPDRAGRIYRAEDRPGELRRRLLLSGRVPLRSGLELRGRAGIERLTGALDGSADRTSTLLEMGLDFRPTLP